MRGKQADANRLARRKLQREGKPVPPELMPKKVDMKAIKKEMKLLVEMAREAYLSAGGTPKEKGKGLDKAKMKELAPKGLEKAMAKGQGPRARAQGTREPPGPFQRKTWVSLGKAQMLPANHIHIHQLKSLLLHLSLNKAKNKPQLGLSKAKKQQHKAHLGLSKAKKQQHKAQLGLSKAKKQKKRKMKN